MSSQVKPIEGFVLDNNRMSSSLSFQTTTKDASILENTASEEETANEQLLKTLDEIYRPVLKLMKILGMFCKETSLKRFTNASAQASASKRRLSFSLVYCGVVVSGLLLNFVISFVDIFVGNNIYLYIMFSFWSLLTVLNGIISFFVLCVPAADSKKSRFEIFIINLLAISSNVNLEKLKGKSRRGIILLCFCFVIGVVGVIISSSMLEVDITTFPPWNEWLGFRVISVIFAVFGEGAWLLPVLFYYITCLILEELFEDLHKRMSTSHSASVDITTLHMEHHKLCDIVELADKVLSPLAFGMVSVCIPLICFNFYKVVNLPEKDNTVFLAMNLFWLLTSAGIITIIMLFGSRVSEKIHSFQKVLETFHVSKEDDSKLFTAIQLMNFRLDLQGDPKGLSIGGLVVITKSMSLTTVGMIVSYFAVMLSLPK